ncbi:MAG TPA: hypothetical protein PK720_04465 [bacterium]|nr:hypothetical protein [bacterium]
MHLVRNAQDQIVEVEVVGDNTELTISEVSQLLAGEAASVELCNARLAEYPQMIAELEAKKLNYDNGDADAFQVEIDKWTAELAAIPAQKASAKARLMLYNKYV